MLTNIRCISPKTRSGINHKCTFSQALEDWLEMELLLQIINVLRGLLREAPSTNRNSWSDVYCLFNFPAKKLHLNTGTKHIIGM